MIPQPEKKGLFLVSTPIGNLKDITLRAIETLKTSDLILCEDTRVSIKILKNYKINKRLISYHKFNEKKKTEEIINYLLEGKVISLISDAGTPIISDPGNMLIKECIKNNIKITPIPGPSSVISSLIVSGFSDRFTFYGFLSQKKKNLIEELEYLSDLNTSIVLYFSPNKLKKNINHIKKYFNNREIVICREMTKLYEEFIRCKAEEIDKINFSDKGELTIVISEKKLNTKVFNYLKESDKKLINKMLPKKSIKDIIKFFKERKISKKIIYDYCLSIKK